MLRGMRLLLLAGAPLSQWRPTLSSLLQWAGLELQLLKLPFHQVLTQGTQTGWGPSLREEPIMYLSCHLKSPLDLLLPFFLS